MPATYDVVYADAYGAMPNPDYDSGPAIQEAIDSLPPTVRGIVALGDIGCYATKQPIYIRNTDGCTGIVGKDKLGTLLQNQCPPLNATINVIGYSYFGMNKIGIVGHEGYVNDGIFMDGGNRCYYDNILVYPNGNGINIKNSHTIYISKSLGGIADYLRVTIPNYSNPPMGSSWIKANSDIYGVNCLYVSNNISEGRFSYAINANNSNMLLMDISNNQFEGGPGLYLTGVNKINIKDNYWEGLPNGAYPIYLKNCLCVEVGRNVLSEPSPPNNSTQSTIYAENTLIHLRNQHCRRLWLKGNHGYYVRSSIRDSIVSRIQNELTNPEMLDWDNVHTSWGNIGSGTNNHRYQYADAVSSAKQYPFQHDGDKIYKRTQEPNTSPGWFCTRSGQFSVISQTIGNGPCPEIIEYIGNITDNFRIIVINGGNSGIANFKCYRENGGAWTEVAIDSVTGGVTTAGYDFWQVVDNYFILRWPTGQSYIMGDTWEFEGTAATWTAMPVLP